MTTINDEPTKGQLDMLLGSIIEDYQEDPETTEFPEGHWEQFFIAERELTAHEIWCIETMPMEGARFRHAEHKHKMNK